MYRNGDPRLNSKKLITNEEYKKRYANLINVGKQGNVDEYLAKIDEQLGKEPNVPYLYNLKAYTLASIHRNKEALNAINKALLSFEKDGCYYFYCYQKGKILRNQGHYAEAIKYLKTAADECPDYRLGWFLNNLGDTYAAYSKHQEAFECFKKATTFSPDDSYGYVKQGFCLIKMKEFQQAVDCFDNALKIRQQAQQLQEKKGVGSDKQIKVKTILTIKGWALAKLQKYKEALECFDEVLKNYPDASFCKQYKEKIEDKNKKLEESKQDDISSICSDSTAEGDGDNKDSPRFCHICFELKMEEEFISFEPFCKHSVCLDCDQEIKKAKNNCPFCREKLE